MESTYASAGDRAGAFAIVGAPLVISGHGVQVHTFSLPLKLRGLSGQFPNTNLLWERSGRSEPTAVGTVVLHPDGAPHMVEVFLSHLGIEKLSHGTRTTVSLASFDPVEVLLEWRQDLSEGDCWTLPMQPAGLARKIKVL